ncbi:shikimate kinase [Flavobacteriaceae bacterium]|jgi:shikimate kinase|nr:shikimate kinase [Flavobacteriaceae bacterium]
MIKSLVLMGYMGCGKSALGNKLAQSNSLSFIDLDDYIEIQEKTTIYMIFEKYGELYFRKKERFYLEKLLSENSKAIIALGGGTPCYFDNIDYINKKVLNTLYLKTTPKELVKRLFEQRDHRPMIAHLKTKEKLEEFIAKHLFERIPYYIKARHHLITDDQSVENLSLKIEKLLT